MATRRAVSRRRRRPLVVARAIPNVAIEFVTLPPSASDYSPLHVPETPAGDDDRNRFRAVRPWSTPSWSVGGLSGKLYCRLGVGMFFGSSACGFRPCSCLSLHIFRLRSRGICSLQNRNSIGQDPCRVVSSLEASCRGDGEVFTRISRTDQWREPPLLTRDIPFYSLSQITIRSHRWMAQMIPMIPLEQTPPISCANATQLHTGAPPPIADCQNAVSLPIRGIPPTSSLYMACTTCQGAQSYTFV